MARAKRIYLQLARQWSGYFQLAEIQSRAAFSPEVRSLCDNPITGPLNFNWFRRTSGKFSAICNHYFCWNTPTTKEMAAEFLGIGALTTEMPQKRHHCTLLFIECTVALLVSSRAFIISGVLVQSLAPAMSVFSGDCSDVVRRGLRVACSLCTPMQPASARNTPLWCRALFFNSLTPFGNFSGVIIVRRRCRFPASRSRRLLTANQNWWRLKITSNGQSAGQPS